MNTRSLVQRAIPFAWLLLSSTPAVAQQVINGTTVTVPSLSQPSPWNTGALTVGSTGTGTLNVGAGGVVNSTASTLGSTAAGRGTVNVSGAGASWTAANGGGATLTVGSLGAGSLTIGNGGRVQTIGNASANVGSATTGTGTVTVTGAGSSLSVANALFINAGTMQVANGGSLSAATATLNGGSLSLTGSDSRLSLVNNIFIRNAASVILADGAQATSFRVWIGEQASAATSRLTVRNGARWIMDPSLNPLTYSVLTVGRRANGELLIESGGVVSGVRTTIGGEEASNVPNVSGVVTVAGSGSLLATREFMNVGELGTGTLSILQGGTVTSGSATVGTLPTGHGSITVDGAGSSLIVGQAASGLSRTFVVGNNGNVNSLTVSGGGLVEAHDSFTVGRQLGAHGNSVTVTGAGSKLWVDGGFAVGRNGANNSTLVRDGARLETLDQAWIGGAAGSPAIGNHVDITGAGTMWLLGGDLHIGSATSPLKDGVEDTPPPVVTATAANNYLLVSGGGAVTQTGGGTTIGAGGNQLLVDDNSTFTSDGAISVGDGSHLSLGADARVNGGSLAMSAGSQLDVFAQEGNSSLLSFSGKAELGGTLSALIDGRSSLSYRFLVLEAGEVDGTFDRAVLNDYSANLGWTVQYTPEQVWLQLNAIIGDVEGLNENQRNVADSLDDYFNRGGQLPPSFVPILGLTGSELGQALSQLSGEVGASGGAAAAASANTSFLRSMLNHAAPACEARREDDPLRRCEHAVWAAAFGSTAELPGNGAKGSHDTTITTSGLVTGWDYAKDDMRVGVAIAGGGTGWNLDGSGMGNGDATFLQLGAYGTKQMGQAYAALAGAYALQAMSTERRVTALQDESLDADLIANAVAGRGEAGYRFGAAAGLGVTPYAALQGQAIRLPGYDESGTLDDGSYALSFNATTTTAVRSELGLGLDMDTAAAAFSARAAWAHDWLNDGYARAGFQSLPGTSFIVNGAEAPADIALVSLSAEADLSEQTAVTARFDGEFGADYQSYAGTLALTYSW
ncbi:hypothetical protein DK847_01210 [Aestuariivirga litoralis]|uniref:Autotransporter domain-containing protein n=1 Tax=Aestuariivirga litoralis TaxID=2650924 RepID=A0A2W2AT07_9HYPH|nr:autotransporter outer membrane beta-barrel domain-containing protein [Aestuariivirga litoralis]PZF78465.1 hypothetical protein DK847_01210 [Aestuariivirga litoralis]